MSTLEIILWSIGLGALLIFVLVLGAVWWLTRRTGRFW